jgi:hypothetical protein
MTLPPRTPACRCRHRQVSGGHRARHATNPGPPADAAAGRAWPPGRRWPRSVLVVSSGLQNMTGKSGPAGTGPAPAASTGTASTDTASVSPRRLSGRRIRRRYWSGYAPRTRRPWRPWLNPGWRSCPPDPHPARRPEDGFTDGVIEHSNGEWEDKAAAHVFYTSTPGSQAGEGLWATGTTRPPPTPPSWPATTPCAGKTRGRSCCGPRTGTTTASSGSPS